MSDTFNTALGAPSGRLAGILVNKFGSRSDGIIPIDVRARLDRLISAHGRAGLLARVRLAADLPLFFDHAPAWTKDNLIPLFNWSHEEAGEMWSARLYSSFIGSPSLFTLFKRPFLELFGRQDVPTEALGHFSEWIVSILIVNRSENAGYSLSDIEARAALRRAGSAVLPKVANRLALELERAAPEQKADCWSKVVGNVFEAVWPLDVELQTSAATFELVRLLLCSGSAFAEAADAILPFLRPEDPRSHTTIYSIFDAPEDLYKIAPEKLLDVVAAIVGDANPSAVYALSAVLARLRTVDPKISERRKFQKLLT